MNNMAQTSTLITQPYPAVGQITSPYEQQKPVKDLNKYATLKAVGKKLFTMKHNDEKSVSVCHLMWLGSTLYALYIKLALYLGCPCIMYEESQGLIEWIGNNRICNLSNHM